MSKKAEAINDAYYTGKAEAIKLLEEVAFFLPNKAKALEPAVGSGIFPSLAPEYEWHTNDLYPCHSFKPDTNLDYLTDAECFLGFDAVITNPPFGWRSGLAKKFLAKALATANIAVAMVLPGSFANGRLLEHFTIYNKKLVFLEAKGLMPFHCADGVIRKVNVVHHVWACGKQKSFLDCRQELFSIEYCSHKKLPQNLDYTFAIGCWGDGCVGKYYSEKASVQEMAYFTCKGKSEFVLASIPWNKIARAITTGSLRLQKAELLTIGNYFLACAGLQPFADADYAWLKHALQIVNDKKVSSILS